MRDQRKIKFKSISDQRGSLISFEEKKNIPFGIKRVYFLYNNDKDLSRGFHAHIKLKQVLVCITGSCEIIIDDGNSRTNYELNNSEEGLYIEGCLWREIHHISDHCVLAVLASEYYDENDYIRDYDKFLSHLHE